MRRRGFAILAVLGLLGPGGAARGDEIEGNVVYLPMPAGELLTVDNRLGTVRLRGWDEPQVRITATKRADAPGVLDRLRVKVDLAGGKLRITTGVTSRDHVLRPLPLAGAGIDLIVDAPRAMSLQASTFNGDIDASGFRGGAQLESQHGEIRAADLGGKVDTRSLAGRQSLQGIHGPLDASGIEGDMELESIDGATIDATVYKGQITARELKTPVVRLRTTYGAIIFVGALQPGGRYELSTLRGDLRMSIRPSPFRVVARAPLGKIVVGFALTGGGPGAGSLEGEYRGGGASLELASAEGSVSLNPVR